MILKDSVWNVDPKHVNVYVKVDEGKKYYIRNIKWVGNTVYTTDYLSRLLDMKKGDVYNQTYLNKRLHRMRMLWVMLIGIMDTSSITFNQQR